MNALPFEKRALLKRLISAGMTNRQIQRLLPCSHATVTRYKKMWKLSPVCGCGRPAGHQAWCHVRLDYSPDRRGFLFKRWGRRKESEVAHAVDGAVAAAKTLGHALGPFVWTSAMAASLAFATCRVCGKSVRIFSGNTQWERFEEWRRFAGNAATDQCYTPEQRAARTAAHKEKRSWREGKRTLQTLRSHLRKKGSTPDLNSPP